MINYSDYISIWDFLLLPFYLFIIFLIANNIKNKHINTNPIYQYYTIGLFIKIFGGIVFNLIYIYHYGGGDTTDYYEGGRALVKLLFKHPYQCLSILLGETTLENWHYFDITTGWPPLGMYHSKPDSFAVMRFITPFLLISFNKLLVGTAVLDWLAYAGIWRFYRMACEIYPKMIKQFAIAVLFIPSVIFWGSGIMKDTFTFTAALWFTYNIYMIFIKKKNVFANVIVIIINVWIIILLKPYIIVALLPASLMWISFNWIKSIRNNILRFLAAPCLIVIGLVVSSYSLSKMGDKLGTYSSMESIISKAQVTQQDLVREEAYGTHSFDIGQFDASLSSILKKMPMAIIAGLFRPFLWEVRNAVMLISGIETFIFLIWFIYILIRVGIIKTIRFVIQEPLLLFSFVFAIIFAFAVGLTTANFGALVRYRIPAIPFIVISLFILYQKLKEIKRNRLPVNLSSIKR